MRRFRHWLGHWSGPAEFADGAEGSLRFSLRPLFRGTVLNVEGDSTDSAGNRRYIGAGLWSLDAAGRIVASTWADQLGCLLMHEQPDDDDAIALEGPLPGNRRLSTVFRVSGGQMLISSAVLQGYGGVSHPRSTGSLVRIGIMRPLADDEATHAP